MRKFPRMRTSNEVIADIKKEDPKTSIREYTIEQLVAKGIIGHIDVGKKRLVDYDEVLDYFNCRKIPSKQNDVNNNIDTDYNTIPRKRTSRF